MIVFKKLKIVLKIREETMPKEVLSYYLKNRNQRIRLGFQIALQCAPFLKGLKVSCVITMDAELYDTLPELFFGMNIAWHRLYGSEEKCLILFYRPGQMEEYLSGTEVHTLLREYGYGGLELEEMLHRLAERVRDCSERGMGFPHEIGAFLGYPIEDVRGFIENEGRKYLMIGYWKVYSDLAWARMTFKEYDRAKNCAVNEFLTGKSIREIAL